MDTSTADWNYTSENNGYTAQAHKSKNIHETRGKAVGGSSNANYMVYVRGNKADFDSWVAQGNEGWDWNNVTYYYMKSELFNDSILLKGNTAALHGTHGFLGVTRPLFPKETKPYFDAFSEIGHEFVSDINGFKQMGYGPHQFTVNNGLRQSTAVSFIRPIRDRPNLHILTKTLATKVIINENKEAIGVKVKLHSGNVVRLMASKEVILSAGAINSPQLLMLSGVGPKDHLKKMNIPLVLDSPNVGQNLQDHTVTSLLLSGKKDESPNIWNSNPFVDSLSFPGPILGGHVALNKSQTYPDYQANVFIFPPNALLPTIMCSHIFKLNDEICEAVLQASDRREVIYAHICYLHPKSRGSIKLRSGNPEDPPLINLGHFNDPSDLDNLVAYVEDFLKVLEASHFRSMNSSVIDVKVRQCTHLEFASREYWRCYGLNTVSSQFHVSGTCAMGPKGTGVLDAQLRLRGVRRLRVADGSIIPLITSGNTNAPIIMIAEKAADMIKSDHGNCGLENN